MILILFITLLSNPHLIFLKNDVSDILYFMNILENNVNIKFFYLHYGYKDFNM